MTRISDLENVARAIFSPQMIGENGHNVTFNVFDCSDMSTTSHAGINFVIEGQTLKGGSNPFLPALVTNQPESFVMMAIQEELLNIAKNKFVRF